VVVAMHTTLAVVEGATGESADVVETSGVAVYRSACTVCLDAQCLTQHLIACSRAAAVVVDIRTMALEVMASLEVASLCYVHHEFKAIRSVSSLMARVKPAVLPMTVQVVVVLVERLFSMHVQSWNPCV
jgi:hypothetical protein